MTRDVTSARLIVAAARPVALEPAAARRSDRRRAPTREALRPDRGPASIIGAGATSGPRARRLRTAWRRPGRRLRTIEAHAGSVRGRRRAGRPRRRRLGASPGQLEPPRRRSELRSRTSAELTSVDPPTPAAWPAACAAGSASTGRWRRSSRTWRLDACVARSPGMNAVNAARASEHVVLGRLERCRRNVDGAPRARRPDWRQGRSGPSAASVRSGRTAARAFGRAGDRRSPSVVGTMRLTSRDRVIAGRAPAAGAAAATPPARRPTACARRCSRSSATASQDARVLDLFAGSGALGIEALSRGAAEATFVDTRAGRDPRRSGPTWRRSARTREVRPRGRPALPRRRIAQRRANTISSSSTRHTGWRSASGRALSEALPAVLAPGARWSPRATAGRRSSSTSPSNDERRYGDTLIRIHGP